jgi:signal transduction histidine kinase
MLGSIRWRLVASYVLITLLTAGLIGFLTLSLIRHYVRQQETARLTANAETIAHQALPLMQPVVRQADLMELAQTASFFVNARVRILDDEQHVLADSGLEGNTNQFLWIAPPTSVRLQPRANPSPSNRIIMALASGQSLVVPSRSGDRFPRLEELPPGAELRIIRRIEGPWGDRIILQNLPGTALATNSLANADDLPEPADAEDPPRSQQVILATIGSSDRPVGHIELSSSPDFSVETLATTSRALLPAAGGATLLAAIIGLLVSRGLTAPLRGLRDAATRMSGGDLSARAPARGKGEVGQLATQFNEMADRLESSFAEVAAERDALRRFIADASHELRTPITALKTFNELLQGPAGDEPSARAEFLAESQSQINRLGRITHSLLDLSRLDAGLVHLDLSIQPVSELIETSRTAFKNLAQDKGVTLRVHQPVPPVSLCCDRARIESALCNLLDNAVKFTSSGGEVEIGAEESGQTLRLWVRDNGTGISFDDLPHIFERFYRGQASEIEGSGLGLAIVQSVVQAHRGQVVVESQPDRGSLFILELPLDENLPHNCDAITENHLPSIHPPPAAPSALARRP